MVNRHLQLLVPILLPNLPGQHWSTVGHLASALKCVVWAGKQNDIDLIASCVDASREQEQKIYQILRDLVHESRTLKGLVMTVSQMSHLRRLKDLES